MKKVEEKQKALTEYKDSLRGKTMEELQSVEEQIVQEADKLDKEIQKTEFDFPEENYAEVCEGIRMLLNKQTVGWQYALAYMSLYDFWNPEKKAKKIQYPVLDSTLRILGSLEFTGYVEWATITAINKYFEPLKEEYTNLTERVYDIAARHNVVMELMGLNTPIESKE